MKELNLNQGKKSSEARGLKEQKPREKSTYSLHTLDDVAHRSSSLAHLLPHTRYTLEDKRKIVSVLGRRNARTYLWKERTETQRRRLTSPPSPPVSPPCFLPAWNFVLFFVFFCMKTGKKCDYDFKYWCTNHSRSCIISINYSLIVKYRINYWCFGFIMK